MVVTTTRKFGLAAAIRNLGAPLTGNGLEGLVNGVMSETLQRRIAEYGEKCKADGRAPDPTVEAVLTEMQAKGGPTFSHMRALSKVIPAIKDLSVTGTYLEEKDLQMLGEDGKLKPSTEKNTKGQLYVFSADTEPDLLVSIAVHASASFPKAFRPVEIRLSSGVTVRFIDGGVMNNTPTTSSVGDERDLDPVPQTRAMTFVFEGSGSSAALKTPVKPPGGIGDRIKDWFLNSQNSAAARPKSA